MPSPSNPTFALIGAAGFVAKRHLEAMRQHGGELVAAMDPHDSVGILDSFFPHAEFFSSPERFERYLNARRGEIDYVSVCSPNYLHDTHCRMALFSGAHAICEKPLVLSPWNVDALASIESRADRRIFPVLHLRHHPSILRTKALVDSRKSEKLAVEIRYVTRRGPWYVASWKGNASLSGGMIMNLGVHIFDVLIWMFGAPTKIHWPETRVGEEVAGGRIEFERATATWFISTRQDDLPQSVREKGGYADRQLIINGEPSADFSLGFTELHHSVYAEVLAGDGLTLAEAKPSIQLVYDLTNPK